jgi:hypothetical protein
LLSVAAKKFSQFLKKLSKSAFNGHDKKAEGPSEMAEKDAGIEEVVPLKIPNILI